MKRIKPNEFGILFCLLFLKFPLIETLFDIANRKKTNLWENDFALLCRWDCVHYKDLGYSFGSAFFPLFPNIAAGISDLFAINPQTTVLALAFFFSIVSSRLSLIFIDTCYSGKNMFLGHSHTAWIFTMVCALYPHAHFFIFGYPESLFQSLVLGGLILWKKNKDPLAGLCFGLTAICRAQGIWIAALFGLTWLIRQKHKGSPLAISGVILSLSLPFVIMMLGQWMTHGTPLFFLASQGSWGREFQLVEGLLAHLPRWETDWFCLIASYGAFRWLWKKKDNISRLLALATMAMIEIPLFFGGYYSYSRFMLLNTGLFLYISHLAGSRPWILFIYLFWALPRLTKNIHHWMAGLWTG